MENTSTRPHKNWIPEERTKSSQVLKQAAGDAAKRGLDIAVAALGLLLSRTAASIFVAIWIKRDSPGPVFYRGPRVGRGGKHVLHPQIPHHVRATRQLCRAAPDCQG